METKFTHNGIQFDLDRGLGEIMGVRDIDNLGFVAYIRPSVFLALCPPAEIARNRVAEGIAEGRAIGMPFLILDIDGLSVVDHEGRHRMSAILDLVGDVPMPVAMFPHYDRIARHAELSHIQEMSTGMIRQPYVKGKPGEHVEGPILETAILHGEEIDLTAAPTPGF